MDVVHVCIQEVERAGQGVGSIIDEVHRCIRGASSHPGLVLRVRMGRSINHGKVGPSRSRQRISDLVIIWSTVSVSHYQIEASDELG